MNPPATLRESDLGPPTERSPGSSGPDTAPGSEAPATTENPQPSDLPVFKRNPTQPVDPRVEPSSVPDEPVPSTERVPDTRREVPLPAREGEVGPAQYELEEGPRTEPNPQRAPDTAREPEPPPPNEIPDWMKQLQQGYENNPVVPVPKKWWQQ